MSRWRVVISRTGIVEFSWYGWSRVASQTTKPPALGFNVVATTTATTISTTRTKKKGGIHPHDGTIDPRGSSLGIRIIHVFFACPTGKTAVFFRWRTSS